MSFIVHHQDHVETTLRTILDYLKENIKAERQAYAEHYAESVRKKGKRFLFVKYGEYTNKEIKDLVKYAYDKPYETFASDTWYDGYTRFVNKQENLFDKFDKLLDAIVSSKYYTDQCQHWSGTFKSLSTQGREIYLDKDDAVLLSYFTNERNQSDRFKAYLSPKNKGKKVNASLCDKIKGITFYY